MSPIPQPLLTIEEFAEERNATARQVRAAIDRGAIPAAAVVRSDARHTRKGARGASFKIRINPAATDWRGKK